TSRGEPWTGEREAHRARPPRPPRRASRPVGDLGAPARPAPLRPAVARHPGLWAAATPPGVPGLARARGPHPLRNPRGPRARRRRRPGAGFRARAAPSCRRDIRAAPVGVLRDPERRLVSVADAVLRAGPGVEDRLRRAARLLPGGARRAGRASLRRP